MNTRIVLGFSVALMVARNASAEESAPKPKLMVVQSFVTDGSDKKVSDFARDLTEELVAHAARLSRPHGIKVRSERELQIVGEQVKDMADLRLEDCTKLEECLARMFEGEADLVLRGTLNRLAEDWVVTLKLIDLKTLGVVRDESCGGESREELVEALKLATGAVLGYSAAAPQPMVEIPSDGRKIGIVPIRASDADAKNAAALDEMLGVMIRDLGFSALTKGDLISMINYATDRQAMTGVPLTDAIMEIASSSGVSMLVTGNIGRAENTFLITLKLIDLDKGEVTNRVLEGYIGEESGLAGAMKYGCYALFGRVPSGQAGAVSIVTDVEGTYRIDQGKNEPLPQVTAKTGLAAGKHQLNISSPGFFPHYADLYLFEGESVRYRPILQPLPRPFYESPLFISIAGVIVAGTATAIVIAAMPDGSGFDRDLK